MMEEGRAFVEGGRIDGAEVGLAVVLPVSKMASWWWRVVQVG
jgi:hypothetical protein